MNNQLSLGLLSNDYDYCNNNNFINDANKHTSCDWELSKNEIWIGNTSGNNAWEKGVDIPMCYAGLKTIRLGEQAYCIKGKPLSRDYCRPLIIDKSEEEEYSRIYMKRMSDR
jgi:hypothetical protein